MISQLPPLSAAAEVAVSATRAAVSARLQRSKLFREYQHAFEVTTGLPLVFRASGSFRTPLQGSKRVNAFCTLMTQGNKTCGACLQLQQRIEDEATQGPRTLRCYAGLNETAVPVRMGNQVLGYLQTGQVFFRPPSVETFKAIARVAGTRGGEAAPRELSSAYFQTRIMPRKQYDSIIRLLTIFAEHLATVSNRLLLSEQSAEPPAIKNARAFIALHRADILHLSDVAHAVHMSTFGLCRMFKQTTGLTFTDYLARERIEAVKHALLNLHTRVSEAAFAAGFQSLSQFNRVFRRVAGEAPSVFRDRLHGGNQPLRLAVQIRVA